MSQSNFVLLTVINIITTSRAGWKIAASINKWAIAVSINEQNTAKYDRQYSWINIAINAHKYCIA